MGLAYYRVEPALLEKLQPMIEAHESDMLGPRARGYWFERPDVYDYSGVQATARQLDLAGRANAVESLELSEVQAHSLSFLDVELPSDGHEFHPALFVSSAIPAAVRLHLKAARRLGENPEQAVRQFSAGERDPRFADYVNKQLRHLRDALPLVWNFYERAASARASVLVVDLRARDLEIPEEIELMSV
ncbi:MAG TPA: hypothetical protein VKQ72_10650 [Aggregatilineales bacterium]|nr:hypothetical protein [Aggregatilineales bacterium]